MKVENQVCSFEQGVRLFNMGIVGAALFHVHDKSGNYAGISVNPAKHQKKICIPAFTVAELGVMLPEGSDNNVFWSCYYNDHHGVWGIDAKGMNEEIEGSPWFDIQHDCEGETEADVRAQFLIFLLENGHTTAEEVNQRLAA